VNIKVKLKELVHKSVMVLSEVAKLYFTLGHIYYERGICPLKISPISSDIPLSNNTFHYIGCSTNLFPNREEDVHA
jgi:hypothetical protein